MWLLPDRESPMLEALTHNKEFTVILVAEIGSPCIGSTLSRLGIDEIDNLSLIGYEVILLTSTPRTLAHSPILY